MNITVKEIKNGLKNPQFELFIDDEQIEWNHCGSRRLTATVNEDGNGIFNNSEIVKFQRADTWITVDFGSVWNITSYSDPAREIKRRVQLVNREFEAVSTSYEKVWTENLDENNEYIEKRKAEAAQASHYFDGLIRYEMENCYEEADEINEESFRVVSADGYDDTHLIAFCDIPQEAYFLKLTRID